MLHQLLKTFAKHDFHVPNKVWVYFVRVIRHPFPLLQILEAVANIYLKSNSRTSLSFCTKLCPSVKNTITLILK